MKGLMIGAVAALALARLTYFGLEVGAVTTAARYSVQSVQFGVDTSRFPSQVSRSP